MHVVVQPIPRTFSSYKTETLYPLNNSHPLIPPSNPWQWSFYFVSLRLRTLDTSESEIRQCLFGTGLFHLAECPQGSFLHGSISENLLLFFFFFPFGVGQPGQRNIPIKQRCNRPLEATLEHGLEIATAFHWSMTRWWSSARTMYWTFLRLNISFKGLSVESIPFLSFCH